MNVTMKMADWKDAEAITKELSILGFLKLVSRMLAVLAVDHVELQYWMTAPIQAKTTAHIAMLELLFNAHRIGIFQKASLCDSEVP